MFFDSLNEVMYELKILILFDSVIEDILDKL